MKDRFLRACRREQVDRTPLWLMRQAGRYMPEYRELRKKHKMLDLCRTPELAAQVTLMPFERFDFDAAILFSDITIPFYGLGVEFDLVPGVGPVVESPIATAADVEKLRLFDAQAELPFVAECIKILRNELTVPLIGFAGAPFTMSAYLIEGKPSRDFKNVRKFMYCQPEAWHSLMTKIVDVTISYLTMQADAGAQALQVFDSWVGGLAPKSYREYLLPHMSRLFSALKPLNVPLIHFGTGTASLLADMKEAGGDVIGIDWKTPLVPAWDSLGDVAVQGNLDPALLLAPWERVEPQVRAILDSVRGRRGHIFNLGHGILPETPIENVKRLVELVHGNEVS